MAEKINGRLEQWKQLGAPMNRVEGFIYDDPDQRFMDGDSMWTSTASAAGLKQGDILQTKNSRYLLGEPAG